MRVGNHLVLVFASKLTQCLHGWSKLTGFQRGGRRLTLFMYRYETIFVVWAVGIDLS